MITVARIAAIAIAAPLILLALVADIPFRFVRIVAESWRAIDAGKAEAPFIRMPTHEGSSALH